MYAPGYICTGFLAGHQKSFSDDRHVKNHVQSPVLQDNAAILAPCSYPGPAWELHAHVIIRAELSWRWSEPEAACKAHVWFFVNWQITKVSTCTHLAASVRLDHSGVLLTGLYKQLISRAGRICRLQVE